MGENIIIISISAKSRSVAPVKLEINLVSPYIRFYFVICNDSRMLTWWWLNLSHARILHVPYSRKKADREKNQMHRILISR